MSKNKKVKGYIQFLSHSPLLVGLWTDEDLKHYQDMVTDHALIVDATCGIAANVNSQRIFYFAFAFYNRNVITEAVPVLEILTDKPNEESLKFLLIHYLDTLGKRSGSNNFCVPLLAVCDIS